LQRIARDANRASDVITKIRRFLSRGDVQRERSDFNMLVVEAIDLVALEAKGRMVQLAFEPFPDLPWVVMDRTQLQQVLVNLIINGIEAMIGVDPPKRQLRLRTHFNGVDEIQLDVHDVGHGIDHQNEDAVFAAFESTKKNGMGMGLAISLSIMESHGGRLWFSANEGPGVTFSLTLPVDRTEELI
jgi:signal transduction histidine kinase